MDRFSLYVVTLLSVYLSIHSVNGKCRGPWTNYHGCIGGNGKRGYEVTGENALDDTPLLERLLSGDLSALRRPSDITVEEPALSDQQPRKADFDSSSVSRLDNYLKKIVSRLENRYDDK